MIYFEDIEVGAKRAFGSYAVTHDDVVAFAQKFDPQPFHLSDAEAAKTYFGRLSASGWHTASMMMRMLVDSMTEVQQAGLGSPGIDELRWLKPVYPGDTLRVETEIADKTPSRSRPEMGSFRSRITVFNQNSVAVMKCLSIGLVRRRPKPD